MRLEEQTDSVAKGPKTARRGRALLCTRVAMGMAGGLVAFVVLWRVARVEPLQVNDASVEQAGGSSETQKQDGSAADELREPKAETGVQVVATAADISQPQA